MKIEEEDKTIFLSASLPPPYENMLTTILYEKETLELEEVIGALLSHEIRREAVNDQAS